jgi:hypothetical protein
MNINTAIPAFKMFSLITEKCKDADEAREFFKSSSEIFACWNSSSSSHLSDGAWDVLERLANIDRSEIICELTNNIPKVEDHVFGYEAVSKNRNDVLMNRVYVDLAKRKRQEQRIAYVVRMMIEFSELIGLPYRIELFTKFEQIAVNRLKRIVEIERGDLEFSLAQFVYELYNIAYPGRRGQFLLDFSKEVGGFRHLGDAIRSRTYSSQAIDVRRAKNEILLYLDRKNGIVKNRRRGRRSKS